MRAIKIDDLWMIPRAHDGRRSRDHPIGLPAHLSVTPGVGSCLPPSRRRTSKIGHSESIRSSNVVSSSFCAT